MNSPQNFNRLVIAIDGFSSCGKSTLARQLAQEFGYRYIDTGAMYRAVTLYLLRQEFDINFPQDIEGELADIHIDLVYEPAEGKQITLLNNENVEFEIRGPEVSAVVSRVSEIHAVREMLVQQQRRMGSEGGVVMDGRDIGTVVFPNADLKLFMTADENVRAQRRQLELQQQGREVSLQDVAANLMERDYIDSHRADSPLRKADDAIVIDNSSITPEEQLAIAINYVQDVIKKNAALKSVQ